MRMSIARLAFSSLVCVLLGLGWTSGPAAAFNSAPSVTSPVPGGGLSPGLGLPDNPSVSPDLPDDNPDAPDPELQPTDAAPHGPLLPAHFDLSTLPAPVAAMRAKIIAAAKSADMAEMRKVIELNTPPPAFSMLEDGDPIEVLRASSGDADGYEVLAILLDVLDAGWVVKDAGTSRERYVWPYFAEYPTDALTPQQMVDVYRVLTAGDFDSMKGVGAYEFFRAEIAADGRWLLFMSGE